jgi:hypothetical protein
LGFLWSFLVIWSFFTKLAHHVCSRYAIDIPASLQNQVDNLTVVARIRPLLNKELDKDVIVRGEPSQEGSPLNIVRIPNPKNESEEFSFTFNGVYEIKTTQEELFTTEGTWSVAYICD